MKKLKKGILTSELGDADKYWRFIHAAHVVLHKASQDMDKTIDVNPGFVIVSMNTKHPDLLEPYDISADHTDNIRDAFPSGATIFSTLKLTNKIVDRMMEYLECDEKGVVDDPEKCWFVEMKRIVDELEKTKT
jgi:hypothetical protein